MPQLDVSEAFDSMFNDDIVIIRRQVVADQHGRGQVTITTFSTEGVVLPAGPNDLLRLPEGEIMNKVITIYSQGDIRGPSQDQAGNIFHPDEILWNNSVYLVRTVDDYSQYGSGFLKVIAVSTTQPDQPPFPNPVGSA